MATIKCSAAILVLSAAWLMSGLPANTQPMGTGGPSLYAYQIWLIPISPDPSLIQARGYGSISPKEHDRAKAYIKARDVAYANAVANLMIALQGVQVSHRISVRDHEVQGSSTEMNVSGLLQGAETISERVVTLYGAPAVEMIVGIRLPQQSMAITPTPDTRIESTYPVEQPRIRYQVIPKVQTQPSSQREREVPARENVGGYTSVIIDARGFHLRPSMSPHLLRPDGSEIWGTVNVDPDFAIHEGIAVFTKSMAEARAHPRAGNNPLVIQAIGVYGPGRSDVIVSDKDARLLKAANAHTGFLQAYNVIFIMD